MVDRDQKESDDLLDKLVASTRSPHGQFTAEKSWPLLQKRIQGGFGWYLWYHRVASLAAVILLCLAGWGIYEYVIPPREQTYAAYAEVRTILLPDSTEVTLNRYSTLTCPVRFKGKNRNVSLSGEAYFEVRKDVRHPFIVQADEVEVKVLGTHFNLEAYPDDPEIKTTLLEGAVAVTSPGGVARLSPNEAAVYSRSVRRLSTIRTKKTNPEIAWRQGDFVFDNEPLREIARKLSHAFDTPIIIQDDSLADYRIRARFSSHETLDEILSLLKETDSSKARIEDETGEYVDHALLDMLCRSSESPAGGIAFRCVGRKCFFGAVCPTGGERIRVFFYLWRRCFVTPTHYAFGETTDGRGNIGRGF